MFDAIRALARRSAPIEFETPFATGEAVERLRRATRRFTLWSVPHQSAVGTVTASRVSLQRVIPMVGNGFKPFFRGRFVERGGKTVLVGRFTMLWFAKIFLAAWFGGLGAIVLAGSLDTAFHRHSLAAAVPPLLSGIAMAAVGAGIVLLGRWFARNDVAWLSAIIRDALEARVLEPPPPASVPMDIGKRRPGPITAASAICLTCALLEWAAAASGIRSVRTEHGSLVVTHFDGAPSRWLAAAAGTAMLLLAVDLHRRRLLAWRVVLALIAAGWIYSCVALFTNDADRLPRGAAIGYAVVSLAVTLVWARWWHAQRVQFRA